MSEEIDEGFIEITVDGVKYTGEWRVHRGKITVHYATEQDSSNLGTGPGMPLALAKTLLGELVYRHKNQMR
jgi:hypothetical protein